MSFFLSKKAAAVTTTSVPIFREREKVGTTLKFHLKPPKLNLTACKLIIFIFNEI